MDDIPRLLRAAISIMAITPFFVGCTSPSQWCKNGFKVGPNYNTPQAETAQHWIEADSPRVKNKEITDARWWIVFKDSTLNELIAKTTSENLTLKAAGSRIWEARAELGITQGNLFPQQQGAGGSYTRNALGNGYPLNMFDMGHYYDNTTVGFNAAWELDFWGRFRRAIEAADAALDAQCAGYNNILVLLQADVAANYIQMRAFEERLTLARKNVELQKETLRIISLREKAGLVTNLDVQQATYNLGQTESMIPMLETGRRKAENRLCILTAKPPQDLFGIANVNGTIPMPPADVVVGIPADLLRRRPDVALAERQAAIQSAKIGIAEAEFYPHLGITGTIGVQSEKFSELFESKSLAGAIGPSFNWNLLNYGRIKNNVKAQEAKFQEMVFNYRDVVLKANEDVENGITAFLNEHERVLSLTKSTDAAQRSVELATHQYEKGTIDYQPLLDSERVLVHEQDTLTESRGLVGVYLVTVYKALGGGWQAEQTPIAQPAAQSADSR